MTGAPEPALHEEANARENSQERQPLKISKIQIENLLQRIE